MSDIRILFLTADPTNSTRLRLGQELRDIKVKLQSVKLRDKFILESRESIRPGDITQAILDFDPHLIHFSGHGTSNGELCFEDAFGKAKPIQADALASLFEIAGDKVKCVLLNACYSEVQARTIAKYIPHVIGMNQAISDKAAIIFAIGFYKALGAGRSFEEAYKFGCLDIELENIPEYLTPILYNKEKLSLYKDDSSNSDLFGNLQQSRHKQYSLELENSILKGILEEEYQTADPNIAVKLRIIFDTLDSENKFQLLSHKVLDNLKITEDKEPDLFNVIHAAIRKYLMAVQPREFFLDFHESIEKDLRKIVAEEFYGCTQIELSNINFVIVDSIFIKYFRELISKVGEINFKYYISHRDVWLDFYADFDIVSVSQNDWYIFQARIQSMHNAIKPIMGERDKLKDIYSRIQQYAEGDQEELNTIQAQIQVLENESSIFNLVRKSLNMSLENMIRNVDLSLINLNDFNKLITLENMINMLANNESTQQYGLNVKIRNLRFVRPPGYPDIF